MSDNNQIPQWMTKGRHNKSGLVTEFFRKGGWGGCDPIHNFEVHFFVPEELRIVLQNRGLWTLSGTFQKRIFQLLPFWVFFWKFFW